jgi:3-methyladenine DNA glycosylase/8-oxoguanine DNA glycosylase
MHWLLSTPDTFSLRNTIQRSGWLLYPPFHVHTLGTQLYRVEHLANSPAVGLTLYQAPAGLVLNTDAQLSGQEIEEASAKVWRMLRLEENIEPFLRLARHTENLDSTVRLGARLIRGATLFEDVLTATVAFRTEGDTLSWELVTGLVDRLGDPLPSNPTLHAFPTPERVLHDVPLLDGLLTRSLIDRIQRLAHLFHHQSDEVEALVHRPWSADDLAISLTREFELEAESLGLLMLSLGRYDHIPDDTLAQRRMGRYVRSHAMSDTTGSELALSDQAVADPNAARQFFARWQPWGGLAYWLWDWSRVSASTSVRLHPLR